jgi:hypothetical protein
MSVQSIARKKKSLMPGSRHASVVGISSDGEITVRLATGQLVACDFLTTSKADPPALQAGDKVMVLIPDSQEEKPVVVGKVSAYQAPDGKHLTLEAGEELTIRCGQATIAFRKSGKILIKGVDIVSHARGRNRIRGASIQMN